MSSAFMSVLFEGEKYPTLCSFSRLVTNLNMVLEDVRPPPSWNLGLLFMLNGYVHAFILLYLFY